MNHSLGKLKQTFIYSDERRTYNIGFGGSRGDGMQVMGSSWLWGFCSGATSTDGLLQLSRKQYIFTGLRQAG
jgi:hypothetical protein